jgi:hypothetical protein
VFVIVSTAFYSFLFLYFFVPFNRRRPTFVHYHSLYIKMKFSILSVLTIATGVMAAREGFVVEKRDVRRAVDVSLPAMSDGNGGVIPFSNAALQERRKRDLAKRQTAAEDAVMSDGNGNVIPFSNTGAKKREEGVYTIY